MESIFKFLSLVAKMSNGNLDQNFFKPFKDLWSTEKESTDSIKENSIVRPISKIV